MTRYDVRAFPNGRVAFVNVKDIDEAIENEKEILLVCNAWSGGYAIAIGADKENDPDFGECYMSYSYEIKEDTFNEEAMKRFHKIIFTQGEKIIMETGHVANNHWGRTFSDTDTSVESINDYHNRHAWKNNLMSAEEIEMARTTVNERSTVNFMGKGAEDKVRAMVGYGILSEKALNYVRLK